MHQYPTNHGVIGILVSRHLVLFYNTKMVSEGELIVQSMADLKEGINRVAHF